jgi:phosphoglycerate kinase
MQGLDIGPDTERVFAAALHGCRCVLWNGPMGVFEWDRFAHGTIAVARAVAALTPQACTCNPASCTCTPACYLSGW